MIRIVVTGDRDWTNRDLIFEVLLSEIEEVRSSDSIIITHGDAEGADKIAGWATRDLQAHYLVVEDPHPARWYRPNTKNGQTTFCKWAGPERNDEMLKLKDPVPSKVIAFHSYSMILVDQ